MNYNKLITNTLKSVAYVQDNAGNIVIGFFAAWCAIDMLETLPEILEHHGIIEGEVE